MSEPELYAKLLPCLASVVPGFEDSSYYDYELGKEVVVTAAEAMEIYLESVFEEVARLESEDE